MHALVIEDMPLTAWLIEEELMEFGYASVTIADSEDAAVAAAAECVPDLIASDGTLESGTGVGAVRRICASQSIPVVFITGDADSVRRLLPDAIIVEKPVAHYQLVSALQRCAGAPAPAKLLEEA